MRLGKNSILGENEVDFPTIKRIVLRFSSPDIMRFLILKTFWQTFFKTHECYDFLWYNGSVESEIFILFENQIQTASTSPCRTQVQPAASFLVCSLIFIEYYIFLYFTDILLILSDLFFLWLEINVVAYNQVEEKF